MTKPLSPWAAWLLPSVTDVVFIAFFCALAFTPLSVRLLGDAGIGWHIRTGQQIVATHSIPHVDSFSSTMQGKPWFAWEWLYDVFAAALVKVFGLNGIVILTAEVIAMVFSRAFRWLIAEGTSIPTAIGLTLLAAGSSTIHFLARPHVLSWLLTIMFFLFLDSSERALDDPHKQRRLWILPLLMLFWVNIHGGFVVGFVLLAIYGFCAVRNWFRTNDNSLEGILLQQRSAHRARKLAVITALSALATLANPYGWELHLHVYRYLSNRFLIDHIDEFQSPNFHGLAQRCFVVLLLIAFVALSSRIRRVRLSEMLVVLFAVYSGLYSSRNLPVSSLLLVLICGPLLPNFSRRKSGSQSSSSFRASFFTRMATLEVSLKGRVWPALVLIVACGSAVPGGCLRSTTPLMDAYFDPHRFPVAAVNVLARNPLTEPILCPDAWGGYLIYRLYPQTQVVVDDRHDLYGEAFFKSYLEMLRLEPGWQDFLIEHKVQRALLPKASPLANILMESKDWRTTYADETATLFEKK